MLPNEITIPFSAGYYTVPASTTVDSTFTKISDDAEQTIYRKLGLPTGQPWGITYKIKLGKPGVTGVDRVSLFGKRHFLDSAGELHNSSWSYTLNVPRCDAIGVNEILQDLATIGHLLVPTANQSSIDLSNSVSNAIVNFAF